MARSLKTDGKIYYLQQKLQTTGDASNIIRKHFSSGNVSTAVNEYREKALEKFKNNGVVTLPRIKRTLKKLELLATPSNSGSTLKRKEWQ